MEWAHYGCRVNAVAPGVIASSGLSNYPVDVQRAIRTDAATNIPLRRLGTVREVAAAVVFLMTPAAAFVTGATLRVDGGGSLYRPHYAVPDHSTSVAFDDLMTVSARL